MRIFADGSAFEASVKRVWLYFRSCSLKVRIVWSVVFFHVIAVLAMTSEHYISSFLKPVKKPILVTTKMIQTPKVVVAPPPPSSNPISPKKKNVVATPKKENKKKQGKVHAPSKKGKEKKEVAEPLPLKNEMPSASSELFIPAPLSFKPLAIPEVIAQEASYADVLASYLQNTLELPEIGAVTAELTFTAKGVLHECKILETKSVKNSEFLKKRLQELTFPCLNESDETSTLYPITIVFKNRWY